MIRFLKYIPTRYHGWFLDHGWLIPALALFMCVVGAIYFFVKPDPHRMVRHENLDVVLMQDSSGEHGPSMAITLKLPDGRGVTTSTRSMTLAGQITETACVEVRKHVSGKYSYALTHPNMCAQ